MAGAGYEHNLETSNPARASGNRLEKTSCAALSQNMRVRISLDTNDSPDGVIVCGKPEFPASEMDILLNPTVVFEILSPSTERRAKNKKLPAYRAVKTLREIVYVAEETPQVEGFRRAGKNGRWKT